MEGGLIWAVVFWVGSEEDEDWSSDGSSMGSFLYFLDNLAWSFNRASRSFRFCFSASACLGNVRNVRESLERKLDDTFLRLLLLQKLQLLLV